MYLEHFNSYCRKFSLQARLSWLEESQTILFISFISIILLTHIDHPSHKESLSLPRKNGYNDTPRAYVLRVQVFSFCFGCLRDKAIFHKSNVSSSTLFIILRKITHPTNTLQAIMQEFCRNSPSERGCREAVGESSPSGGGQGEGNFVSTSAR